MLVNKYIRLDMAHHCMSAQCITFEKKTTFFKFECSAVIVRKPWQCTCIYLSTYIGTCLPYTKLSGSRKSPLMKTTSVSDRSIVHGVVIHTLCEIYTCTFLT